MKKSFIYLAMLSICIMFFSLGCEDREPVSPGKNRIAGTWTRERYEHPVTVLSRQEKLQKDNYGFSLLKTGIFVERKNSGPCATPPINYSDYKGTWHRKNDSLITIIVGYWGGRMKYNLEIESIAEDTLKIIYHYKNQ